MTVRRMTRSVRPWAMMCGLVLASMAVAHAENCPRLNAATAEGLLGGPVTMSVTHPSETAESCVFARNGTGAFASLHIDVTTPGDAAAAFATTAAQCGANPRKLTGVGNEAVGCTLSGATSTTEQVVGRVRGRIFVLRWIHVSNVPTSVEARQEAFQGLAEAVAGSMF